MVECTSNAAWWIKHPKKNEYRTTTLSQDMTDLFSNISMHGYNKLLDSKLFLCEKLIWFCLHVANLAIVIIILSHASEMFSSQYFGLFLHDSVYPVENIPFPGVSICSNNRISRRAAEKYATELSHRDPYNRSVHFFMEHIPSFGSMYYKYQRSDDYDILDRFQTFLDVYGTDDNELFYNFRKTLKLITPNCRDLLIKCFLNGKDIECFGENAFYEGFTMYGPCCIFNKDNNFSKRSNGSYALTTADMGLTVLINGSHSDDLFPLLNMDAYVVIIHNPSDFPDISSGNAIEVFPMNNKEAFITVTSEVTDTSPDLKAFNPLFRKCYFDDESQEADMLFSRSYSFSNCVIRCRINSIAALCHCAPFYLSGKFAGKMGLPYCTLHHIACFQRYNFKWSNVLTNRIRIPGLERELEEALYCPQCLPSCDDTQYDISMMSLPTDRIVIPDDVGEDFDLKVEDMSLLHVYFGKSTALYYKRVITNSRDEIFSTVGNIVSIFLGFSLVAIFETLFFVAKYLYIALKMFVTNGKHNSKVLKNGNKIENKSKKLYILP